MKPPKQTSSYRVIEQSDRLLHIELSEIEPEPGLAAGQFRRAGMHALIAAGLTAAVVLLAVYADREIALFVFMFAVGFMLRSAAASWYSIRLAFLCQGYPPQQVVINRKNLIHRVGSGWASLTTKLPINAIRTVQPVDATDSDSETAEVPDHRFSVAVLRWTFDPLVIASELDRAAAEGLASLVAETCNDRLGHSPNDATAPPISLGSLNEDLDSNLCREATRPPPSSKARLSELDGDTLIEIPVSRTNGHLSGSTTVAIILGFAVCVGWVFYIVIGPGFSLGLAILVALSLLFAFFAIKAWRSNQAVTSILLGAESISVLQTMFVRGKETLIPYNDIHDITYEADGDQNVAKCRIAYAHKKKLDLLNGQPVDEIVWLVALLRWSTGLNDRDDPSTD
ncbi:MAG: hypothetical protein AAF593_06290 [Planctomycetota bacterium]